MDTLKFFISLLALVNPLGAIPLFISLTGQQTSTEKRHTIKVTAISVALVVVCSGLFGEHIIRFFGISVASLEVGGGIIMLLMAVNMLNAKSANNSDRATDEERYEARARPNIAVVPLAIPLLTGPGTISTVIIYAGRGAQHWTQILLWLVVIGIALGTVVWLALRLAERIEHWLGYTGINIGTRLMGLILSALAVEFIIDGLRILLPGLK
ncbi:MarC family protein [Candidatus Pandoraea novymonadis]|uniref:MarC family protein n=1 Tax=Candidatus Pandoraea novymonadis TaxID=1808959 RepID=UPI000D0495A1|nr:NAAT family transporter [Candidatus Pandoraea novymonadis]